MRILYIGPELGTSRDRLAALRRLGHDVTVVDFYKALEKLGLPRALLSRWIFKAGAFGLGGTVRRYVLSQVKGAAFDLVFVDSGELLDPATIMALKQIGGIAVNYNPDNPYVPRDGLKWRIFFKALPFYDLVATPRASSVAPARKAGARSVVAVNFAADEAVHRPIRARGRR